MSSGSTRAGARCACVAVLLLLACGGGGGDNAAPSGGAIHTEWNLRSIAAGETATIRADAVDANGNPVAFTGSADGRCATVAVADGVITVTAGSETCEQRIVLTSSTGVTKEVIVQVLDPMAMDIGDGLLVRYLNDYAFKWDSYGSGGSQRISYWHPTEIGDGWYALGSIVRLTWGNVSPSVVPMVAVKDSRGLGLLAAPSSYVKVYDDHDSGATLFGSMWNPVCPAGFKALGTVTNGGNSGAGWAPPSLDAIRCVKEGYTIPGNIGARFYTDEGTGAHWFGSAWTIDPPLYTPDGYAALHAGTFLGCGAEGDSSGWQIQSCYPHAGIVNLLLVPMPLTESSDSRGLEPRLTGYAPLDASWPRFSSSVRVPYTLVPNQRSNTELQTEWNVHNSPFFTLQREEVYASLMAEDARQNPGPSTWSRTLSTGLSSTDTSTFSQEIGLSITAGGEAKFLGAGGSWEVTLTGKLGWEQATSTTYASSESKTWTFTIPPGKFVQIVQVSTQFRAINSAGQTVGAPLAGGSDVIKYLQYPP